MNSRRKPLGRRRTDKKPRKEHGVEAPQATDAAGAPLDLQSSGARNSSGENDRHGAAHDRAPPNDHDHPKEAEARNVSSRGKERSKAKKEARPTFSPQPSLK